MLIAFYAPLKSPHHPVPSGDRAMARLLMRALTLAGHQVRLVSDLRVFLRDADAGLLAKAQVLAARECDRIGADWARSGMPDLFVCYHPYYKSPDLIGPQLSRQFALPYVTIEASWSQRRNQGDWALAQQVVLQGLGQAVLNISMTGRDARGLQAALPGLLPARLAPFVDAGPYLGAPQPEPGHFVTAAMMRPGDKHSSYRALAEALAQVRGDWQLSIAGDGPMRVLVEQDFAALGGRVRFLGQLRTDELAALYQRGWLYLWPGHGEAYGLAALEAQAAGLPVISEATAGVPEVVRDGETAILTPEGDRAAYAAAITRLAGDAGLRADMAQAALDFGREQRSLPAAARQIGALIRAALQ